MKSKEKTSRIIPRKSLPSFIYALYALNDGRIAIGGENSLSIYNMKTYRVDIQININIQKVKFIFQLSDNKLFYFTFSHETEWAYTDDYYYNYLIELSGNTYKDVSKILPQSSLYNILREYSDKILFGGISYSSKKKDSYHTTNARGEKRIEKLEKCEKINEQKSEKENDLQEKYQITKSVDIDFEDFLFLNKDLIVVLLIDRLAFYDVKELKKVRSSPKISNKYECLKFALYNEKFILIGTEENVEIFDLQNNKIVKSIFLIYDIQKIYVYQNRAFILESEVSDTRIAEYEIDETGNYKEIDSFDNPHRSDLTDIIHTKDGRLITSCQFNVKIWYF